VKYKALFFILINFFPDSPIEAIRGRIFTQSGSNYAQSRKEVPFCTLHDGRKHLVFDDHFQTHGNICQTAVKMPNHCTHPHWPKQTTYALLCTSSSI